MQLPGIRILLSASDIIAQHRGGGIRIAAGKKPISVIIVDVKLTLGQRRIFFFFLGWGAGRK